MLTKQSPRQRVDLLERVMAAPSGKIDRAAGVIRGVKILGAQSRNGRQYTPQAMREAAAFYEGCGVNLNHPNRETPNASRQIEEGVGWLENISVKADGVYGDLAILKSHPMAESIFEFAERNPSRFGLSHNAAGDVTQRGDRAVVESVKGVRSVDLVQNPATVNSLFESVDPMTTATKAKTKRSTLRRDINNLLEDRDLRPATKFKVIRSWLAEMDGLPLTPDSDEKDQCESLKNEIRAILTKPGANDETKIMEIFKIIGFETAGPDDDVPTTADEMAEAYTDPRGRTRRQRDRISEGASALLESIGGRPLAETQRAKDRDARVKAMIQSWK